jgi:hypothetical protein
MSLIELLTAISSITGAIKGASLGFSLYGIIGLILGIPIGFFAGAGLIIISLVLIMSLVEVSEYIKRK